MTSAARPKARWPSPRGRCFRHRTSQPNVFEPLANTVATRANLIREAAGNLALLPNIMQREYDAFAARLRRQSAARPAAPETAASPPGTMKSVTPEHELLILCLHFETLGRPLSHALPHNWIDTGHAAGRLLNRFLNEFEHDAWPGRGHLDSLLETPEERALVAGLLFDTPAIDDPVKVAQEGLRLLRARSLEPRLRQIELALANTRADIERDPISLLKERLEIQRQLRQPLLLVPAV